MPYTFWDKLIPLLICVVALIIVIGVPIMVVRSMRRKGEPGFASSKPLDDARARSYEVAREAFAAWSAANPGADPGPEIEIRFHTYSGLLVHTNQVEHRDRLSAVEARILLRELHRFNLKHGLLVHGGLFVPFLSYINYRRQLRHVRRAMGAWRYDFLP